MPVVNPGIRFKFRPTKLHYNDVISQFTIQPMVGVITALLMHI